MPELPEVETIRTQLAPLVIGQTIVDASSHESDKFIEARNTIGSTITMVDRLGKYLLFALDDDRELIVHLGMTGTLAVRRPNNESHVRATMHFVADKALIFRDVRRFGRIRVVAAGDYSTIATLNALGPEPLGPGFTPEGLHVAIKASSRRLKTQLLSQRPVAGIGNIYADEALWLAQIHPAVRSISRPQATRLHEAICSVLAGAITNGGTTLRDYRTATGEKGSNQFHLNCYGLSGEPCARCGTQLRSKVYDARTTTWCPSCQRR